MNIVISGGTGFLGRPLTEHLTRDGHTVVHLSRHPGPSQSARRVVWNPDGSLGPWAAEIDGADVVIHLAGESIGDHRWTAAQKRRIHESRVLPTRSLAAAVSRARRPPSLFLSQSAVGYYGHLDDRIVTETAPAGADFLARVCVDWEAEAAKASSASTRVVCLRTGLLLARDGGALPPMLPPFWFGVGGPVGSGRQYWSWIHRSDWMDLVRFVIATPAAAGPINATGPNPVTNREFAGALGRAMHRPAFMPAPAFAVRIILGEMAESLVLTGQRVVPNNAQRLGFKFKYEHVQDALDNLFARA
jgi:uncharacterized protein